MNKNRKLLNAFLVSTMLLSNVAPVAMAAEGLEDSNTVDNVMRLDGGTRVGTSLEVSREAYQDQNTKSVIVAGYNGQADALTGTLLARAKNAPLLLVSDKADDIADVKAEIARLGATNVVLLGGENAISTNIATVLAEDYTIERVKGHDRFDTAAEIAKEVAGGQTKKHVFLTNDGRNGGSLADALTAGPVSGKFQMPVLLTSQGNVPQATLDALEELGVEKITIVGGAVAVGGAVEEELKANYEVDRIKGGTRFETAETVAETYFADSENVILANDGRQAGKDKVFADALVGGYLGAKTDAPILLTAPNTLNKATTRVLASDKTLFAYILGGTGVISASIETEVSEILADSVANAELEEAKTAAKAAVDAFELDTEGMTEESIVAAEAKLAELKTAAKEAIDALETVTAVEAYEFDASEAEDLLEEAVELIAVESVSAINGTVTATFSEDLTELPEDVVFTIDGEEVALTEANAEVVEGALVISVDEVEAPAEGVTEVRYAVTLGDVTKEAVLKVAAMGELIPAAVPYTAIDKVIDISDEVTFEDGNFTIPAGVTAFTFKDGKVEISAKLEGEEGEKDWTFTLDAPEIEDDLTMPTEEAKAIVKKVKEATDTLAMSQALEGFKDVDVELMSNYVDTLTEDNDDIVTMADVQNAVYEVNLVAKVNEAVTLEAESDATEVDTLKLKKALEYGVETELLENVDFDKYMSTYVTNAKGLTTADSDSLDSAKEIQENIVDPAEANSIDNANAALATAQSSLDKDDIETAQKTINVLRDDHLAKTDRTFSSGNIKKGENIKDVFNERLDDVRAVKPVYDELEKSNTNQAKLLKALQNDKFERVYEDYIVEYDTELNDEDNTPKTVKAIQTVIDAVNDAAALKAVVKAEDSLKAADIEVAELAISRIAPDTEKEDGTADRDVVASLEKRLDIVKAIVGVKSANATNLKARLQVLADLVNKEDETDVIDLEEIYVDANAKAYVEALGKDEVTTTVEIVNAITNENSTSQSDLISAVSKAAKGDNADKLLKALNDLGIKQAAETNKEAYKSESQLKSAGKKSIIQGHVDWHNIAQAKSAQKDTVIEKLAVFELGDLVVAANAEEYAAMDLTATGNVATNKAANEYVKAEVKKANKVAEANEKYDALVKRADALKLDKDTGAYDAATSNKDEGFETTKDTALVNFEAIVNLNEGIKAEDAAQVEKALIALDALVVAADETAGVLYANLAKANRVEVAEMLIDKVMAADVDKEEERLIADLDAVQLIDLYTDYTALISEVNGATSNTAMKTALDEIVDGTVTIDEAEKVLTDLNALREDGKSFTTLQQIKDSVEK